MNPAMQQGIAATARALGMSPAEMAAIISYETGGTFNPTQQGPTTQWGQHRGLIQFGEPQAQQYGVDWANPTQSQLGADGAIAKYFRQNGWEPGMGLMDAYSIVNAGAPGRYNASDANNGGAPGTVADKVNSQFAPHIARGEAMFAGAPDMTQGTASAPPSLAAMFGAQAESPAESPAAPGEGRAAEAKRRKESLFGSLFGV